MRKILFFAFCALAIGCSDNNDDNNNGNVNSGATAPEAPAEVSNWTSLYYDSMGMVENPEDCRGGRFTVRADKSLTSKRCTLSLTRALSDEDFAQLQVLVTPVASNFDTKLKCDLGELTQDYDYSLQLVSDGKTKKVFSYGSKGTCTRGDRAQLEALEAFLYTLDEKYFP